VTAVKRHDRPHHGGRSKHRVKIKNRKHQAMQRVMEAFSYAGHDCENIC
jgi:hypothetical protein